MSEIRWFDGRKRKLVRLLPPTGTIEEVKAYRRKTGCSLREAVSALNVKGWRTAPEATP